jgi:hypothetical protein
VLIPSKRGSMGQEIRDFFGSGRCSIIILK